MQINLIFASSFPSITTSSILGGTIGQIQLTLFGLAISNSILMPLLAAEVAFIVFLEVDLIARLAHPVIGLVLDLLTAPADSGVSSDISCHANSSLASCAVVLQQELLSRTHSDRFNVAKFPMASQCSTSSATLDPEVAMPRRFRRRVAAARQVRNSRGGSST